MTTAQQVLDFEGARLGQGGDETWAWYPLSRGSAWCCAFQSMALTSCGIDTHFAWVSSLFADYISRGYFTSSDIRQAQPGDLVGFEWGSTPGGLDHIAMILEPTATGCWTRNGNVNGSRVADLWFPYDGGGMAIIGRPPYSNTPPPSPEDDMRDCLIRDPKDGAVYRITQPGNVAVHLSPPAYEEAMAAVQNGLITDLGVVSRATLGNFGILPSILEVKG